MHLTLPVPDEFTTVAEISRQSGCAHETIKKKLAKHGILPDALLKTGGSTIPLFKPSRIHELDMRRQAL
jgi:hypothetical protein